MKRFLILAMVFMTLNNFAQDKRKEHLNKPDFTPEQLATLKSKQLALELNLDESQRQKIYELNLDQVNQRKSKREEFKNTKNQGERPSSDERFNIQNRRLDEALAHKAEMKGILNKAQFEKWEKGMNRKTMKRKRLASRKMLMKRKRMIHTRRL